MVGAGMEPLAGAPGARRVLLVPPVGGNGRMFSRYLRANDVVTVCNIYAEHQGPGFDRYATTLIDHTRRCGARVCMAGSFGVSCVLAALQAEPDLFSHVVFFIPTTATHPQLQNIAYHEALLQSRKIEETLRIVTDRFPELRHHDHILDSVVRAIHCPTVRPLYTWMHELPPVTAPSRLARSGADIIFIAQPDDLDHEIATAHELSTYFRKSHGVVVTESRWDYLLRPAAIVPVVDRIFDA
jgi:hypothetical protein